MSKLFLVTNPGSSSRKYALYKGEDLICSLHFEFEGDEVVCTLKTASGRKKKLDGFQKLTDTVKYVQKILTDEGYLNEDTKLDGIVARVASSGDYFAQDHIVDDEYLEKLEQAKRRAPLHVPIVAAEIAECVRQFKKIPVLAISDSAFHTTRDEVHTRYAIDPAVADRAEIKRFGYHGLSMGSIAHYLKEHNLNDKKVVVCHLGSGSSLTALKDNKSFDTSMGYSPLEGLMMATRCGDIDAAAATALARELDLDSEELEQHLNKQSGLKGIAGTDDMREVIALKEKGYARATLAYDMFISRVRKSIGRMAASLEGIDALVFTATIGERNSQIRADIINGLGYLGFKLDEKRNEAGLGDDSHCLITTKDSKPAYVILTDETGEMIRRAQELVK